MSKVHPCPNTWVLAIVGLFLIVYCILIVVGNLLVCIAIIRFKKLRKKANFLLVSLSVSDLCIGVFILPVYIVTTILCYWPIDSICFVFMALDISLCTASLLHICAIAVDRYIAVAHPLRHHTCMTSTKVGLLIGAVWLVSLTLFFYTAYKSHRVAAHQAEAQFQHPGECVNPWIKHEFLIVSILVFHIPLIITVGLYLNIVCVIRRNIRSVFSVSRSLEDAGTQNYNGQTTCLTGSKDPRVTRLHKDRKTLRIIGFVLGAFTICWLPFFVVTTIEFYTQSFIYWLNMLVTIMGYVNSGINPLIYSSTKRFRVAFMSMLKCETRTPASTLRTTQFGQRQVYSRVTNIHLDGSRMKFSRKNLMRDRENVNRVTGVKRYLY
ncbi:D(2) dopamine receptor-like [Lineus longissimus]|uniref:D(2) dopamine receptor-like n=1 Tax=Lineus longissimus TaxID=88925 RepID=UPI002B4E4C38